MDYLHINAIIRETYLDAQCGCVFPEKYKNKLHEHVANDDFLKNTVVDNVMTYFSIREENRPPVLVLANVDRQKSCESVGRAVQCLGWEWDSELINSDMSTIFDAGYYTENEYVGMMENGTTIPLPSRKREKKADCGIQMSHKVKKAIMTAVFLRWLRNDNPIRIAVPNGVDYNSYVWQAVEKLYALFPVALRLEAGFCSYMPDVSKASNRVYLGFIPEEMADTKTMFLDGSRQSAITAMERGTQRKNLDQFIDFICGIDDTTREGFIQEVYEDLEGAGDIQKLLEINPKDYQTVGEATGLLMLQGSLEQMLPQWSAFYRNQDKQSPKMRARVINRIHQLINPNEFCQLICNECSEKMDVRGIADVVSGYHPFYLDNADLATEVWKTMLRLLRESGESDAGIYSAVRSSRETLGTLVTTERLDDLHRLATLETVASLRAQKDDNAENVERLISKTEALYRAVSEGTETAHKAYLLEEIRNCQDELIDKRNEIACQRLREKYLVLRTEPADKLVRIQRVISKGKELLAEIDGIPDARRTAELKQEVLGYIAQLDEKIHSSDTKYAHIEGIIRTGKDYFAILEALQTEDRVSLEEIQLEAMSKELESIRPASLESYRQEFEDYYHRPLNLQSVSKLADFVCRTVTQDVCAFNTVYVSYSAKDDALENLEKVSGMECVSKQTSNAHTVRVWFQNMEKDSDWARHMLKLTHTSRTMGSQEEFEAIFFHLVDSGAYHGTDLQKCIRMFEACDLKYTALLKRILMGKFEGCTEAQYLCAFETIANILGGKRNEAIQKMQRVCKDTDNKDNLANKAFGKFLENNKKKPVWKRPKVLLPTLIGVSAVAVALLIVLIIMVVPRGQKENAPSGTTTMPHQTQPVEMTYLDLHELLARDGETAEILFGVASQDEFSVYADQVVAYMGGLEDDRKTSIVDAYLSANEPVVIDDDGTQADWDEFFFWVCWSHVNAAEADPEAEFSVDAYREDAYSILRVIYQTMPQEAEEDVQSEPETLPIESEPTEEPTEPETEATQPNGDNAANQDNQGETQQDEPPSLDEVIARVCDAAQEHHAMAADNAQELKLTLALFGWDYTKDFAEHREMVEVLLTDGSDRAAALMKRYHALPANAKIVFVDDDISVTWNEYMFWECWVLANFDVEEDNLNDMVLGVLYLVHELPPVNPAYLAEVEEVENETVPTETTLPPDEEAQTETSESEGEGEVDQLEPEQPEEPDALEQIGFATAADEAKAYYEDALTTYRAYVRGIEFD